MSDIEDNKWNNERSIVDISFEGQVGKATIIRDANNKGHISFMFNEINRDRSKIKIREMEISYGANSDRVVGDELNFDNIERTAYITITSKTGIEKEWSISFVPFSDEIIGNWKIKTLSVYGGAWPEYGGSDAFQNIAERAWNWQTDGSGPIAEYDNILEFQLDGISENGDTYGTLINHSGPDNKNANFIFIDDPDGAKNPIDVNYHYRKLPIGESKWRRNSAQGTITFTDAKGKETVGRFINATNETEDDGRSVVKVSENAFVFTLSPTYVWIDIYKDREKLVENAKKYWVQVSKIE